MNYILGHQDEFVKPTDIKIALTLLGEGTVCPIAFLGSRLRDYLALISKFPLRTCLRRRPYTQETGLSESTYLTVNGPLTLLFCLYFRSSSDASW